MQYFLAPFHALSFLKSHGTLWRYVAWPFGITIAVVVLSYNFIIGWVHDMVGGLFDHGMLWFILAVVVTLGFAIVSFYLFTFFLNLISGPFNEVLSEKVEEIVHPSHHHKSNAFSWAALGNTYLRTITAEVQRMVIFGALIVLIFALSFFLAGSVFTLLSGLVSIFFLMFEFIDYPLARHEWSFWQKLQFVSKHWLPLVLFGLGLSVFLLIPILNLLFIPVAVISGTRLVLQLHPKHRRVK